MSEYFLLSSFSNAVEDGWMDGCSVGEGGREGGREEGGRGEGRKEGEGGDINLRSLWSTLCICTYSHVQATMRSQGFILQGAENLSAFKYDHLTP